MITEIIESTFEDLIVPDTIYKYRYWGNQYNFHKTILTEQQLYFASPKDFEDKIDCKNLVRWDLLTDEQIYQLYYLESSEKNPHYNEEQHKCFAEWGFNQSPIRNKELVQQYMHTEFDELCNRLGILSLTEHNDSVTMWKKYSLEHTGICVGFNTREIFKYFHGGGPVSYYDTLPIIFPRPTHSFEEQITLQIYSKELKWSFEREYRTIVLVRPGTTIVRVVKIPKNAITEVIIGARASEKTVQEVTEIIKTELPHVSIKMAVLKDDIIEIH